MVCGRGSLTQLKTIIYHPHNLKSLSLKAQLTKLTIICSNTNSSAPYLENFQQESDVEHVAGVHVCGRVLGAVKMQGLNGVQCLNPRLRVQLLVAPDDDRGSTGTLDVLKHLAVLQLSLSLLREPGWGEEKLGTVIETSEKESSK